MTNRISNRTIEAIMDFAHRVPSPYTAIAIAGCHGACARVSNAATAYAHQAEDLLRRALVAAQGGLPEAALHHVARRLTVHTRAVLTAATAKEAD